MMSSASPASSIAETPFWGRPLFAALTVFLLVYGVELAGFSLSIDEEAATFMGDTARTWLSQGRWGMTLLTYALPNFEAIPLLSTVLFGAGLLLATWRAYNDFALTRPQALIFAVVHVGFPLWLHIAEFNTLAGGFGVGLAAAAFGGGLAVHGRGLKDWTIAIALLAFAFSIYQTLAVYTALYITLALHVEFRANLQKAASILSLQAIRRILTPASLFVAALVAYWAVQRLSLKLSGTDMSYVGGFMQLERLQSDPSGALRTSFGALASFVSGKHAIYLGSGIGVLLLTWAGLLPIELIGGQRTRAALAAWLLVLGVVLIAIALIALPFVASVGGLPARAHIALPLLAAWLASRCVPNNSARLRFPHWLALAYFGLITASIGSSLFYADRVARDADAALTERLMPEVIRAAGPNANGTIPFTLSGQFAVPAEGQIKRAEVFGTSFYEHDGGNAYRVGLYLKLQGISNLTPVWLGKRPDLIPAAQSMPTWPAPGSVQLINGVVIIKLGAPTPQQLSGA